MSRMRQVGCVGSLSHCECVTWDLPSQLFGYSDLLLKRGKDILSVPIESDTGHQPVLIFRSLCPCLCPEILPSVRILCQAESNPKEERHPSSKVGRIPSRVLACTFIKILCQAESNLKELGHGSSKVGKIPSRVLACVSAKSE